MKEIVFQFDEKIFENQKLTVGELSLFLSYFPKDALIKWYVNNFMDTRDIRIEHNALKNDGDYVRFNVLTRLTSDSLPIIKNAFDSFNIPLYPGNVSLKHCLHPSYVKYQGLNDSFEYCTNCGDRKK